MEQTYQQILAEVYDENAKNVLVHQTEYDDEEQPPYEKYDYSDNEVDDKEEFNKFAGDRGKPEHVIRPEKVLSGDGLTNIKKDSIIRTNVINIDGNFRQNAAPPQPLLLTDCGGYDFVTTPNTKLQSGSNFSFRTSRQYKNTYSVEVTSIEFPNSFYAFSSQRKNTLFSIEYNQRTYDIRIPDGNYSKLANLTTTSYYTTIPSTNGVPIADAPPPNPQFPNSTTTTNISGPPTPDITTFLGAIQEAINKNIPPITSVTSSAIDSNGNTTVQKLIEPAIEVGYSSQSHLIYFTQNDTSLRLVPFNILFPSVETNSYGNGIGYNLGILELNPQSKIQAPPGQITGSLLGLPEQIQLIVADTFPDIIQDRYVFLKLSDWDLITHVNANSSQFTAFMKIVLSVPKYTVQFDNASSNSTHKQYHFQQPTNINLINISLLDAYGNVLDMKYSSFSLTLQIQECLSNATYEALLENK